MGLIDTFNYYYYDMADPRVMQYFIFRGFWPIVLILFSYLYFIFQCGPRYMKHRPAYELKTFIRVYNIFQVVANAYIVREFLGTYPDATAFRCVPGDYSWSPEGLRVVRASYLAAILKIIDLIETGVFILRKKKNQVTILHLYHHISTMIIAVICARYISTGMAVFVPILNCSVHVIMYTYYFLSNLDGPIKQMVLPLKRYITIIQMVQFIILAIHLSIALLPSCPVPKIAVYVFLPNIFFNFGLFYKFYKKAYLTPQKNKN